MERHPKDDSVKAYFEDSENQEKRQRAIDKIRETSNMAEAHHIANDLRDRAKSSLSILPDTAVRRSLLDLADYVCDRNL
jgi:geranylgeranyl pyrophosphate synthase